MMPLKKHAAPEDVVTLFAVLNYLHPLNKGLQKFILKNSYPVKLNKGKYLLKAGDVCTDIYFVKSGLLRGFIQDEGKDITTWITAENDLVAGINSFFTQTEADENIQALEDCELIAFSYTDLNKMYSMFPSFNVIARKLYQKNYIEAENRALIARLKSADKKYGHFLKSQPHLANRVAVKYIASFLGIATETLSRLRQKMAANTSKK
jgi:CRP-like cAMP-binding protein